MSIFQIICIVMVSIILVVFAICVYLEKEGADEADFISGLLEAVSTAVGLFSLLLGAIGLLTWNI